ncbi:MAG: DUF3828 domain-containing protein [Chloroflexi bacterium]|jgi:hypothetical protein|nr:DUF3828 domain-containing protein [Chloroflexota bacterium]
MKNKNQLGFLIILAAAIFSALAFVIFPAMKINDRQSINQPDQVVQDFYTWYLAYDGNPLVDKAYQSSSFLSTDFITFLDDFTQAEMRYDPILCAQDKPTEINTSQAQVSGAQASVEVSTSLAGHQFTVELVQIDNAWLMNRVICQP